MSPRSLRSWWRALEAVPGQEAVEREWRALLGEDFPVVRRWLTPTGTLARSLPPEPSDEWSPRARVVRHADGGFVAVCDETDESQVVTRADLALWRPVWTAVVEALRRGLRLTGAPQDLVPRGVRLLGEFPLTDDRTVSVHLVVVSTPAAFAAAVRSLLLARPDPSLVLVPTGRFADAALRDLLAARHWSLVELDEKIGLGPDDRLIAEGGPEALVAELRRRVGAVIDAEPANLLRRDGQTWRFAFAGSPPVSLPHREGFAYLRTLLENPGKRIAAVELLAEESGVSASAFRGGIAVADGATIAAVRAELSRLKDEYEEATESHDARRQERLAEAISAHVDHLTALSGKGGRQRLVGAPEKARDTVRKAIDRAIVEIAKACPKGAEHFHASLHRGHAVLYQPDEGIRWKVA